MVDIIKAYKVSGDYNFRGQRGKQEGELFYCSDNKIVGTLYDLNGNKSIRSLPTPKLLLGVNFPDTNSLGMLKVASLRHMVYPVVWSMEGLDKCLAGSLSNRYEGYFELCSGIPFAGLQLFLAYEGIPSKEILKEIPLEDLISSFDSSILKSVARDGELKGQVGELELTEFKL